MALPLVFVVLSAAGRVVARYATKKAADAAAKRIGGTVTQKTLGKTVSKVPTGGSTAGRQRLAKETIDPSKSGIRTAPKTKPAGKPDPRGSTTQKVLMAGATTGLTAGAGTGSKTTNNRSQSQGGRSRAEVIEERQKRMARKSAEQGGGAVLSGKAREKQARDDLALVTAAAKKSRDNKTGTKNFNVGVSKGGVSFNEAFKHFRKKGAKTFTWNGKKYTTKLKSEK